MQEIIDLSFIQLALAYVFVLLVMVILRIRGIKRDRELLISSVRMTLQLMLVGYILVYVFAHPHPLVTLAIIVLMEAFAVYTVINRFKQQMSPALKRVVAFALCIGTFSCLAYFLLIVVQISPWYEPRYFIPIAGMLVGNAMTGISLAVKTLLDSMSALSAKVEEALILGATPQKAVQDIINSTFDAAILPTLNSMLGMGIVFLPGMMTGQILSGTAPTTAISYQIAIMLGILGAVALAVIIMLQLGYRTFFNAQGQFIMRDG